MPAIIPVAGMNTEFGMEWDASLMPVAPNYTALEASVYEVPTCRVQLYLDCSQ